MTECDGTAGLLRRPIRDRYYSLSNALDLCHVNLDLLHLWFLHARQ
jgi:hypothetical protein